MFYWLKQHQDIGILIMRLFMGSCLVYVVSDAIFSWNRMLYARSFLAANHFPFPLLSAILSVYAQAIAGLLIIIGLKIRWVALVMVFHFAVA